ncbi:hypothetical protein N7495_004467 [Penicillium taxi]|uniref:uncharacterized protein n=1 Tax=Penicillium taxi TaxID=168475 RepID=UPI0025451091|nr:uncharacterized protein N7495_004467 [Penicillium taxi]KAJ5899723.1 hypothetical protein N7495_004467 [Penicillium taxi]
MIYSLLLLSFGSFVSSYPFNEIRNLNPPLRRSDGVGYGYIPAADCSSPCEVYFNAVTTTLTISAPAQTVTVSGAVSNPVTVTYSPVTTVTTIQPSVQTLTLYGAESNYVIPPTNIGSVSLHAEGTVEMITEGLAAMHISFESEVLLVTEDNPEVTYRPMNPYKLQNNCAYVTMAHLSNMSLFEFLGANELMQDVNGISSNQIRGILEGLPNYTWAYVLIDDSP